MTAQDYFKALDSRYPGIWEKMDEMITSEASFDVFKQLSDNYSPTLTVSRVQGPLVTSLMDGHGSTSSVTVDSNAKKSGSISIKIGDEAAAVWFSSHADICSYLSEPREAKGYPLTPFCMTRAKPGARKAVALSNPDGNGPLQVIAEGHMVTEEDGSTYFDTTAMDLPLWTRVVYHSVATWDKKSDVAHGYIDNQASGAAHIMAARLLSHYDVNAQFILNDEEEGPVDMGNQGFSRALNRLLHRTPITELPDLVIVSDTHGQGRRIDAGEETDFGKGAVFAGYSSKTRGAVTPPQLVSFNRELIDFLATKNIMAKENPTYVGRSDDISAMQFTPNVVIVGTPGTSSHFDETPTIHISDLVNLTRTLVVYALVAQEEAWCEQYL